MVRLRVLSRDEDPAWQCQTSEKTRAELISEGEALHARRKDAWSYSEPAELTALGRFHPRRLYRKVVGAIFAYCTLMEENFGARFMIMLLSVYFGLKGFVYPFSANQGLLFYFRDHITVSATDLQAYTVAATAPWSMKALFGAFADAVPLLGFHKRSYIAIVSIAGSLGCFALAIGTTNPKFASMMFFLINFQISVTDLLTEGKYAELMALKPKTGGAMVSWVWNWYQVAGLAAILVIGPMVDEGLVTAMFWLVLPFTVQTILPVVFGFFPETRVAPHLRGKIRWDLITGKWNYFLLAVFMFIGSAVQAGVSIAFSDDWRTILIMTLLVSVMLCTASMMLLPRMLGKAILYLFFSSALYININNALSYYYLADNGCVEDGPHFSATYYTTVNGVVAAIAGMAGVSIFYAVMNDWHFRPTFWVTIVMRCAAGVFDFVIVKRWNRDAGVSDHVMYMMGSNIILQVAYMMEFMPGVVLISKLCPENVESTVYALLAGFSNFGAAVAQSLGLAMLEIFDVDFSAAGAANSTNATDTGNGSLADSGCSYSNLPILIVLCNMVIPLGAIPLTFLLVPNMRLTDKSPTFHKTGTDYVTSPDYDNDNEDEAESKLLVNDADLDNGEIMELDDAAAGAYADFDDDDEGSRLTWSTT